MILGEIIDLALTLGARQPAALLLLSFGAGLVLAPLLVRFRATCTRWARPVATVSLAAAAPLPLGIWLGAGSSLMLGMGRLESTLPSAVWILEWTVWPGILAAALAPLAVIVALISSDLVALKRSALSLLCACFGAWTLSTNPSGILDQIAD